MTLWDCVESFANVGSKIIYITKVDTSIKAKVRSWNIMIEVHDENVASDITFKVSEMYPGMPNYHDYATVINNGESQGTLEFVIKRVQIFDSVYTLDDYTSDQLVEMLADNYPFKIDVSLTNNVIDPGHTEQFIVDINWPYESGDDIADTYWGNQAYTYMKTTNSDTCISIMAEIRVDQAPTN